jgi:hypothetical protein
LAKREKMREGWRRDRAKKKAEKANKAWHKTFIVLNFDHLV